MSVVADSSVALVGIVQRHCALIRNYSGGFRKSYCRAVPFCGGCFTLKQKTVALSQHPKTFSNESFPTPLRNIAAKNKSKNPLPISHDLVTLSNPAFPTSTLQLLQFFGNTEASDNEILV